MTEMIKTAQPLAEPPRAARAVQVGRRLTSAPLPKPLATLRAASKKLAWTAFEARLVTTPLRYTYRELVNPTTADYTLGTGGTRFSVRHRSGDIDIFRKFYAYRYYEWPAAVTAKMRALGRPLKLVDLGANIGFFQVHARSQMPIGEVTCFEPDPANSGVLEHVRDINGAGWRIIRACASNAESTVRFRTGGHNFSRIEGDGDLEVPAHDVFPIVADADLVKMNIEGSEWEILEDPRLAENPSVWIVEYHRMRNPDPDITSLVRRQFEHAGFETHLAMSVEDNGLLWAWKS
jgi:FkbM family methyltransferase